MPEPMSISNMFISIGLIGWLMIFIFIFGDLFLLLLKSGNFGPPDPKIMNRNMCFYPRGFRIGSKSKTGRKIIWIPKKILSNV